jgi:hypothetical protein
LAAKQCTSGGLQHWEALLGGLTTFAEAAQLLETLAGVDMGIETLRTHAEAAGTQFEGEQRAAMPHVEVTQEPPANYAPVAEGQTLVVEADGVMARYRDPHLDGTVIEGDGTRSKLGLVGRWQDSQLVDASYVAARETAASFAPRLGTEGARRGALDIHGWRGLDTDGGGDEAILRRVVVLGGCQVDLGARGHHLRQRTRGNPRLVPLLPAPLGGRHCVLGADTPQAGAWVTHAKEVI